MREMMGQAGLGFLQLESVRREFLGRGPHRTAAQQVTVAAALLGGVAEEQNSGGLKRLAKALQASGGDVAAARELLKQVLSSTNANSPLSATSAVERRRKALVKQRCVEDPKHVVQKLRQGTAAQKEATTEVERSEAEGSLLLLRLRKLEESVTSSEEEREDAIEESDRLKAAIAEMQSEMKKANKLLQVVLLPEVETVLARSASTVAVDGLWTAMVQMQDSLDALVDPEPAEQKLLFQTLSHVSEAFGEQLRLTVKGVKDIQKQQAKQQTDVSRQKDKLEHAKKVVSEADPRLSAAQVSCDKAVAAEVRSMVNVAAIQSALQLMS